MPRKRKLQKNVLDEENTCRKEFIKTMRRKKNSDSEDVVIANFSPLVKYNYNRPSVDEVLERIEKDKKEWELVKKNRPEIERLTDQYFKSVEERKAREKGKKKIKKCNFLNCKHLTEKELDIRFEDDLKFIEDTFFGRRYCERNELFKEDCPSNNFTVKDLRLNESFEVFTQEQLIYLVSLFRKRFDEGNIHRFSDYYFKVLLPEYTLKIFMDTHCMEYNEAIEYLKEIPAPEHIRELFGAI